MSKARREVTKSDIKRIARRLLNHTKLHQNDIIGTELLISELEEQKSLLFYQKQLVEIRHKVVKVTQHFQLGIMTPWGAEIMKKLGKKLAFIDACHGMNQYGYAQITLLVVDEYREIVPVAYAIVGQEDQATVAKFLSAVKDKIGVDFEYGALMMDRGKAQIAACEQLGIRYLSCIFHLFQDLERVMRNDDFGMHRVEDKERRKSIMQEVRQLRGIEDEQVFYHAMDTLVSNLREIGLESLANYIYSWKKDAVHWVAWGRLDVNCIADTNNPVESFFRVLKYHFSRGKVAQSLQRHAQMLVEPVHSHYVVERDQKLSGMLITNAQKADEKLAHQVGYLLNNFITKMPTEIAIGGCFVRDVEKTTVQHKVTVGDASCQCSSFYKFKVCPHLEAAGRKSPLTLNMMKATADHICNQRDLFPQLMKLLAVPGAAINTCMYTCPLLADQDGGRFVTVNVATAKCECHAFHAHNMCCHVIAGQRLSGLPLSASALEVLQDLEMHPDNPLDLKCERMVMETTVPIEQSSLDAAIQTSLIQVGKRGVFEGNNEKLHSSMCVASLSRIRLLINKHGEQYAEIVSQVILQAEEKLKAHVPKFVKSKSKAELEGRTDLTRLLSDKTIKPLMPNRAKGKKGTFNTDTADADDCILQKQSKDCEEEGFVPTLQGLAGRRVLRPTRSKETKISHQQKREKRKAEVAEAEQATRQEKEKLSAANKLEKEQRIGRKKKSLSGEAGKGKAQIDTIAGHKRVLKQSHRQKQNMRGGGKNERSAIAAAARKAAMFESFHQLVPLQMKKKRKDSKMRKAALPNGFRAKMR